MKYWTHSCNVTRLLESGIWYLVWGINLISITSCVNLKKSTSLKMENLDGLVVLKNDKENLAIKYYGDYSFHSFKKSKVINWDRKILSVTKLVDKSRILLYAGHTVIEPYCSTVGLRYKGYEISNLVTQISNDLRTQLHCENIISMNEFVGGHELYKISYKLRSPKYKISFTCIEYYKVHENTVLRILFWTTDSNASWLESEIKGVLEL